MEAAWIAGMQGAADVWKCLPFYQQRQARQAGGVLGLEYVRDFWWQVSCHPLLLIQAAPPHTVQPSIPPVDIYTADLCWVGPAPTAAPRCSLHPLNS